MSGTATSISRSITTSTIIGTTTVTTNIPLSTVIQTSNPSSTVMDTRMSTSHRIENSSPMITTMLSSRISSSGMPSITATATTTSTLNNGMNNCSDAYIGIYCNISSDACAMSQPCQNAATCFPNHTLPLGYYCHCQTGYAGYNCEWDERPCREDTCW